MSAAHFKAPKYVLVIPDEIILTMDIHPSEMKNCVAPIVRANGQHDDTDGVLAALGGRRFVADKSLVFVAYRRGRQMIHFRAARYRFTRPVTWTPDHPFVFMCEHLPTAVRQAIHWRAA